ncbi:MAG TPA: single-stranded DNA-binding protein [Dehalococcoidia bacterium]|nr:single-stranded DNA-binding protein [Dehalococcoidia bacterium]
MAGSLNKVMIIGNLGADPEMRYTAEGKAITNFKVAVSRNVGSSDDRREETEWFRIVAWEKLAEQCAEHLLKGRKVYVEGRLQTRKWDGQDGQTHYSTEVVANTVLFLDRAPQAMRAGPMDTPAADGEGALPIDPHDLPFE